MDTNEDIIKTILTSNLNKNHHFNTSSIRILDWHMDDNVIKAGNNIATAIYRLVIRYQISEQHEDDINTSPREKFFFVKVPTNAPLYKVFRTWKCYNKEVIMYTQVFPQMHAIDNVCWFTPRQYYFDNKMSLVLEDLTQSGYKCADRVEQLDFEHCFYAFRCLAKFHALSVNLEKMAKLPQSAKHDSFINPNEKLRFDDFVTTVTSRIPLYLDSLSKNIKQRYPNMVEYFRNLSVREALLEMYDNLAITKCNVLTHGDFWTNNVMFKHDKYGMIEKIKLLDFQFSSWMSPAKDLIYFTITSMKYEVYVKYFPLLLKIYLDSLNKTLSRLDCPIYSMQSLHQDIDTMYHYALIVLWWVLPLKVSDPKDALETEDLSKDDQFKVENAAKAYQQQNFRNISEKWFEHFSKNGTLYIDDEKTFDTTKKPNKNTAKKRD